MNLKINTVIIIVLFSVIGSILITLKYFPRIEYRTIPFLKTDTVTIVKRLIVPAIIKDTIFVHKKDTLFIDTFYTKYAMLDTLLEGGNLYLNVKYFIPENLFDLNYRLKQATEIVYVDREMPPKNTLKDRLGLSIGVQSGYDPFNKRLYTGIGINVGYKIY